MQDTQVQSLGQEDPLEKKMATDSSILAWEIPLTEEAGGLQFMGSLNVRHNWRLNNNCHLAAHYPKTSPVAFLRLDFLLCKVEK